MAGQTEMINFLRSLKPFVNKQGVAALDTLENVFDILDDPKVERLNSNIQSFSNLRKQQVLQAKEKEREKERERNKKNNNPKSLRELLKSLN